MRFRTGEEAILFYVETKSHVKMESGATIMVVADEGLNLQFQSNSGFVNNPSWAMNVHAIVDIEKILKNDMTDKETRVLFRLAFYGRKAPVPVGQHIFDTDFEKLTPEHRCFKIAATLQKFEAALFRSGYLYRP